MIPANELLLECPFCGTEKPVVQLMSGNTLHGRNRSDLKIEYPMLPRPSAIQRCPQCGNFYYIDKVKSRTGTSRSIDEGDLSYEESLEAMEQFKSETLLISDEIALLIIFIHAYNTKYQLEDEKEQPSPTEQEQELFKQKVLRLISIFPLEPLVLAEFMREIGDFDKCKEILDSLGELEPFKQKNRYKDSLLRRKTFNKSVLFSVRLSQKQI